MKKIYLFVMIFLGVILGVTAQENDTRNDGGRIQAFKIAYLTKKLNLSPEEAQRFWPIYNKYESEIRSVRIENRGQRINEIETEERILNIRKKYNGEFSKALSTDKVDKLFRSEREFGNMVQKELNERRQQKMDRKKNK